MVLKIAHRGASAYAPENTLKSFEKALELKADCVEFDVRLTKDKKVMVMHDEGIERTTNGRGLIKNLTLKEIKKFHGPDGKSVPTLQEVLHLLKNKCVCIIELKDKNITNEVIKIIRKNSMEKKVFLISPDEKTLKEVRKANPQIKTMLIIEKKESFEKIIKRAKVAKVAFLALFYKHITKDVIGLIHKNNLRVDAGVTNRKKDIEEMKKLGVDAITSDYPDRI